MKILVYPHDLGIGGSQLNAIEIAAAVQRLGHPTIIFGRPGPLNRRIEELGLEFIAAPAPRRRPSPSVVRTLRDLVTDRGIDVVHGYEWPPALECWLASRSLDHVAAVTTVMSMAVAPFIPKHMPLVVGTEQILAAERKSGRARVQLLEPPVDLEVNNPDVELRLSDFRTEHRIDPGLLSVVLVTRLARELKLEGILAAMDAVQSLSPDLPAQLIIVGDGPARSAVQNHAREINTRCGRTLVVLTGELADPRPAYAIADVALGMGGSALRSLAFGKPLIVQGESGFWKLLSPRALPLFLHQGWYGVGPGAEGGAARLAGLLRLLLPDAETRRELGLFGLATVRERFSLERAADVQTEFYRAALETLPAKRDPLQETMASARFLKYHLTKRVRRAAGRAAADDFNARPVAHREPRAARATQSGIVQ